MKFEVTKMGERGQIVIPKEFRENMALQTGEKFIVMEKADMLVFKRLNAPTIKEFDFMIARGHLHAKKHGLKKRDLNEAIRRVRNKK